MTITALEAETAASILLGTRPRYRPRGGARDIYEATDTEVIVSGPAGTGKSRACLERIHHLASTHMGARFLIARKTLASLTSTGLVTFESHVATKALADGDVTYFGGSSREPPQYRYHATGAKIMLGGLDNKQAVQKVMSAEYDGVFVQEAIDVTEADWEALTTRLRNNRVPHMQIIGDTNPGAPTHWIKQRADRGALRLIESRHEDNPVLFGPTGELTPAGLDYMARLDALTGVRHARLRKGLWVAAEGVIYEDFDPAVHVIPRFDIPWDWPRYWSIDFGYTNPMVVQWWAEDPDGRLILYRELYRTQRLVADHAADILALVTDPHTGQWTEPKPQRVVCDHDAEGRAQLRRHLHLPMRPADKSVLTGIEAMARRLRPAGDGHPRMMFMEGALVHRDPDLDEAKLPCCTVEEITGYVWASTPDGKPNREEPLKMNDHGCLIASTLVATATGPRPIDRIQAGDLVWTRAGLRPVLAAGMTAHAAPIVTLTTATGRTITGTGDHPVWADGQGWTRMDALRYGDILTRWEQSTSSPTTGSGSAGTPTPKAGPNGCTTSPASPTGRPASAASTRKSGSPTTAPSPTGTTSTTTTATTSTTTPATWSPSPPPNTSPTTPPPPGASPSPVTASTTSTGSRPSPPSGTAPTRDGHGTPSTAATPGSAVNQPTGYASTAGAATPPGPPTAANGSVPTPASRPPAGPAGSTTSNGPASAAGPRSPSTGTPLSDCVADRVVSVTAAGSAAVFNLTVDGEPEYFAGGVLVHNCDAARYMAMDRDERPRARVRHLG